MDGWNTSFLLGRLIFRCELLVLGRVSGQDHPPFISHKKATWKGSNNPTERGLTVLTMVINHVSQLGLQVWQVEGLISTNHGTVQRLFQHTELEHTPSNL